MDSILHILKNRVEDDVFLENLAHDLSLFVSGVTPAGEARR